MQVTATDARRRFGHYLQQSEQESVHITKHGRVVGVVVSAARYAKLAAVERQESLATRRRDFNDTYREWIAFQHALVERTGVFGEGLRPW